MGKLYCFFCCHGRQFGFPRGGGNEQCRSTGADIFLVIMPGIRAFNLTVISLCNPKVTQDLKMSNNSPILAR